MAMETESNEVPSYLQPDLDAELSLPSAPTGHAASAGRTNNQVLDSTANVIFTLVSVVRWILRNMVP